MCGSQAEFSYLVLWSNFLVDQDLVICLFVFSVCIWSWTAVDSGTSGSAACIFEIIIRYCFLNFNSLSHLRLNLFTLIFRAACLFTDGFPWPVQPPASVNSIVVSSLGISCLECACMHACHLLYTNKRSIDTRLSIRRVTGVFTNVSVVKHSVLKNKDFSVAKFTILTTFSLLSSYKISFPVVGWKISSIFNIPLKPPNEIFLCCLEKR